MIRFLVNAAVYMAAAAIGLVVADVLLGGLSIVYPFGFVVAALLFGILQAVLTPFFESITEKNASMLTGAVGLLSAFAALLVTVVVSDDITVDGLATWFLAALIIWLASMLAAVILKVTVAKKVIKEVRD